MARVTSIVIMCVVLICGVVGTRAVADRTAAADVGAARSLRSFSLFSSSNSSKKACVKPKPTLILISGLGGSQMVGTFEGNAECKALVNSTVVWYADRWYWDKQLPCWGYLLSLNYNATTKSWSNSTGTQLWPDDGKFLGDIPDGSKQRLFYWFLNKHLASTHGYTLGKDLFLIPYDWRTGIQGLEKRGGIEGITRRISEAVKRNCGQKAIVIAHSYGANVMATIFQKPELQKWRQDTVKATIYVGAPFGGCAATTWLNQLSGDFFKLLPVLTNLMPASLSSKFHPTVVGSSVYRMAFGLPTWGWMLPRPSVLGKDHVVVVTPTKNYTVEQQKQLLLDMGDEGGASLLDDSWARSEALLKRGPVAGLETFCLYGTGVPTSTTLVFNESVPKRAVIDRPFSVKNVDGDGVVDLTSLRLCSKLAPKANIAEVSSTYVDHATILAHPMGLERLSEMLVKLGVGYSSTWNKLLTHAAAWATP